MPIFSGYKIPDVIFENDRNVYPYPDEISIQMTYKDVHLNFFETTKYDVFNLVSGCQLEVQDHYLGISVDDRFKPVVRFSRKFNDTVAKMKKHKYIPCTAYVRFIVAWKNEEAAEEIPVLLANVVFRKNKEIET